MPPPPPGDAVAMARVAIVKASVTELGETKMSSGAGLGVVAPLAVLPDCAVEEVDVEEVEVGEVAERLITPLEPGGRIVPGRRD